MIDLDELPIPDWGLRCPHCGAPLAGLQNHRCGECGRAFYLRRVIADHRPIIDIGLSCPRCGYLLTGLTGDRCPECGAPFFLRDMVEEWAPSLAAYLSQLADPENHHVQRRDPTYTGWERPLPDFGLSCAACGGPLVGAEGDVCPHCGQSFDLRAVVPPGDLVNVTRFIPRDAPAMAKNVLYGAQIPYLVDNARLHELYGGMVPAISSGLRVPRVFFFDALHAFATAGQLASEEVGEEWTCPECGEKVPGGFEICWSCQSPCPEDRSL
ncbi:MAG: hypothetical protein JXQ73_18700 [Phycisphaerae bacterium]|nr:hypothetical protein [Phycisphaerae bacterium]